jgi:hypothetical protein
MSPQKALNVVLSINREARRDQLKIHLSKIPDGHLPALLARQVQALLPPPPPIPSAPPEHLVIEITGSKLSNVSYS